ncbi:hypothetical protein SAMN05446635_2669 [Burkholderia sp. OK233]|nr:hypothetical protein SAMN05446635_2669 [Burkholderia sp. OK233]
MLDAYKGPHTECELRNPNQLSRRLAKAFSVPC